MISARYANAAKNIYNLEEDSVLNPYDSDDKMFIVHQEAEDKLNMEFKIHKSGIHYFDLRNKHFSFINTVSVNKEGYTQRNTKSAEVARTLYANLCSLSWK